ncbi:DNA-binding protein BIN4-like [Papaver somniferum]|uniref:DNA-binding protein BIN4-like n=1 Tax=Papaver somniferum TaxID=3469 RepID=UPI000E705C73|nr:DNA-binding protein BIN4-like [Papaver somniferum]XP_026424534.1 DNA-binding protein BIN4-like [Papaver somniferum]XP_026424830.1 DNA-binding protein BIN4-like [Papaver somniferum]XP_026424831.1 DNA-binding protein BIN4-like [Papaver somniferum]
MMVNGRGDHSEIDVMSQGGGDLNMVDVENGIRESNYLVFHPPATDQSRSAANQAPKQPHIALSSDEDDEDDFRPISETLGLSSKSRKEDNNQDVLLIDGSEEPLVSKASKSVSKTKKARAEVETQVLEEAGEKSQGADVDKNLEDSKVKKSPKSKSPKKKLKVETQSHKEETDIEEEAVKAEVTEKSAIPHGSSRLPLMMAEKVQRSKALVECEGDSIDMSGDIGTVGRLVISDTPCGSSELLLDLKGTIYKTTIVPSRTFCVVNFGQTEAKIEAIMDDFIQLKPHSNVYESETMIEGTLEGYSFDSDEEADKIPKPKIQGEEGEEQANGKVKGKADKALGVKKKGKITAKPPAKRVKKKAPVSKKGKGSKK